MFKELNELLDGLEVLAVRVGFAARGGLQLEDVMQLYKLLGEINKLKLALDGLGKIPGEVVGSPELLPLLGARVLQIVNRIKLANKGNDPDLVLGLKPQVFERLVTSHKTVRDFGELAVLEKEWAEEDAFESAKLEKSEGVV